MGPYADLIELDTNVPARFPYTNESPTLVSSASTASSKTLVNSPSSTVAVDYALCKDFDFGMSLPLGHEGHEAAVETLREVTQWEEEEFELDNFHIDFDLFHGLNGQDSVQPVQSETTTETVIVSENQDSCADTH